MLYLHCFINVSSHRVKLLKQNKSRVFTRRILLWFVFALLVLVLTHAIVTAPPQAVVGTLRAWLSSPCLKRPQRPSLLSPKGAKERISPLPIRSDPDDEGEPSDDENHRRLRCQRGARRWQLAREEARRHAWWPMVGQKFGSSILGGLAAAVFFSL